MAWCVVSCKFFFCILLLFMLFFFVFFFFFKQKTAYELRISDWSSDVCSSDLVLGTIAPRAVRHQADLMEKMPQSPWAAADRRAVITVAHACIYRGDARD